MAEVEDKADDEPKALVDGDEEQAGDQDHGDDEAGRDQGLAARGPGDLVASARTSCRNVKGLTICLWGKRRFGSELPADPPKFWI